MSLHDLRGFSALGFPNDISVVRSSVDNANGLERVSSVEGKNDVAVTKIASANLPSRLQIQSPLSKIFTIILDYGREEDSIEDKAYLVDWMYRNLFSTHELVQSTGIQVQRESLETYSELEELDSDNLDSELKLSLLGRKNRDNNEVVYPAYIDGFDYDENDYT